MLRPKLTLVLLLNLTFFRMGPRSPSSRPFFPSFPMGRFTSRDFSPRELNRPIGRLSLRLDFFYCRRIPSLLPRSLTLLIRFLFVYTITLFLNSIVFRLFLSYDSFYICAYLILSALNTVSYCIKILTAFPIVN